MAGNCDSGYSCVYQNTIAWRTPTAPLVMENNPRAVFERLFGASDTTDQQVRLDLVRRNRSIIDSVLGKVQALSNDLGPSDRTRVDQYLDSLRDVERRIQQTGSRVGQDAVDVGEHPGELVRPHVVRGDVRADDLGDQGKQAFAFHDGGASWTQCIFNEKLPMHYQWRRRQ